MVPTGKRVEMWATDIVTLCVCVVEPRGGHENPRHAGRARG